MSDLDQLREGLRVLTIALNQRLANVEEIGDEMLQRIEELQAAALRNQMNQARFVSEHEHMLEQLEETVRQLKTAVSYLTPQKPAE